MAVVKEECCISSEIQQSCFFVSLEDKFLYSNSLKIMFWETYVEEYAIVETDM